MNSYQRFTIFTNTTYTEAHEASDEENKGKQNLLDFRESHELPKGDVGGCEDDFDALESFSHSWRQFGIYPCLHPIVSSLLNLMIVDDHLRFESSELSRL